MVWSDRGTSCIVLHCFFSVLQVDVIAGMQPGQAAKVAAFMGFEGDQLTQVKPSLNYLNLWNCKMKCWTNIM